MAGILAPIINPMRRPAARATEYVLRLTPIGTDMDEVIKSVENHRNWHMHPGGINRDRGFRHPRPESTTIPREDWPVRVGYKSIRVEKGTYWPATFLAPWGILMETVVATFYAFDEDGKLTEVYVWKTSR